jgi:metal-sulfur cluster biosynthetic enzyme
VKVTMTLTTQQCPASGLIFEQVHNRLAGIPDISSVKVDLVWEPKWTPHRISAAGRLQLGI